MQTVFLYKSPLGSNALGERQMMPPVCIKLIRIWGGTQKLPG